MHRLLFVLLIACGQKGPPAKHVEPPPGKGWWCAPPPGNCDREQARCEDNAARLGAERPCTPVESASCFATASGIYSCGAKPGVCDSMRAYAEHRGETIVQACTAIP